MEVWWKTCSQEKHICLLWGEKRVNRSLFFDTFTSIIIWISNQLMLMTYAHESQRMVYVICNVCDRYKLKGLNCNNYAVGGCLETVSDSLTLRWFWWLWVALFQHIKEYHSNSDSWSQLTVCVCVWVCVRFTFSHTFDLSQGRRNRNIRSICNRNNNKILSLNFTAATDLSNQLIHSTICQTTCGECRIPPPGWEYSLQGESSWGRL